jgi:hypothetical protein
MSWGRKDRQKKKALSWCAGHDAGHTRVRASLANPSVHVLLPPEKSSSPNLKSELSKVTGNGYKPRNHAHNHVLSILFYEVLAFYNSVRKKDYWKEWWSQQARSGTRRCVTRWSWHALLRRSQLLPLIVCNLFIVSMACVWSCHWHDELTYNACLARLSIRWWLKKRRKIRSTIKTAARRTGTWAPRIHAIVKMLLGFCPLADEVTGMLRIRWPWALEADHGPSLAGGFALFV